MKRSALRSTTTLERKTQMRPRSKRRADHYASDEGKAGLAHMARVRALPCVICHEWDMVQQSKTEAHHVYHGRYGTAREDDMKTIPLCNGHHTGDKDKTKLAVHRRKKTWLDLYGPDYEWLPWVENRLGVDT